LLFKQDVLTPWQPYTTRETLRLVRLRRYIQRALRSKDYYSPAWCNLKYHLPRQDWLYPSDCSWTEQAHTHTHYCLHFTPFPNLSNTTT
jgi:hypothetical protein